jgi:hypothetical protein
MPRGRQGRNCITTPSNPAIYDNKPGVLITKCPSAGHNPPWPAKSIRFNKLPLDQFSRQQDVNLRGVIATTRGVVQNHSFNAITIEV